MKLKQKKFHIKRIAFLALALFILLTAAALCRYALQNINNSQYRERVLSSNILMEKICHRVETVVDFNWDTIHYVASQLEQESFQSLPQMLQYVRSSEKNLKDGSAKILLISSSGYCYVSDGTSSKWMSSSLLNSKSDAMYVSDRQFSSKTGMQMHYLSRFSQPFTVDGICFTHASLVCDMEELDSFFDVSSYGEDSISFIIYKNGSQVYRQNKQTVLSGIYNLLSALKNARFGYDMTYDRFLQEIEGGINNTVYLKLEEEGYFTSYYHLDVMDWVAVLMVPEAQVGTATQTFAKEIITSVVLLFGILLLVLLAAAGLSAYQINLKHRQVNDQLVKAVSAERAANEAKTTFLSSMSHDIRTPMNAITGMVAIASKRVEDADYMRECLSKIALASDHLLTLINDILDISKVESGKMMLNRENFSLQECFSSLVSIMQAQVRQKHQKFYIRVHQVRHEHLYGDKLRLNQIFINILSNAIKYTPEQGSIWMDLYQEPVEEDPGMVRIRYVVRDTGIGMSKEYQEHMYHSFTRATDSRTSSIQGSGLGLTICKQMIDLMGGAIRCDSQPGAGTVFTVVIELPLANIQEPHLQLPETELLLVDDDAVFLESAAQTLESLGLKADTASSGEEALRKFAGRQQAGEIYPLMIVHNNLPDGKGTQLVQQLRRMAGGADCAIVVSGYDTATFEEEARAAGANGTISKPFFRSSVYDCLGSLLHCQEADSMENDAGFEGLAGIRLLIAEDNDLNWEIAETLLQMYGITAHRAENGKICTEILESAPEGAYAAVLMDVRMPVMDGRQATRILRQSRREWISDIPVIAMTADAFTEDIQECIQAGMDEHVPKPLDIQRLLRVLQKYCCR